MNTFKLENETLCLEFSKSNGALGGLTAKKNRVGDSEPPSAWP